ncbi:hypothetical protein ACFQ0O_41965 [Saccharopolyspora spinosporotrichia]
MTGPQLVAELADQGIKVPSTKNLYHVDPLTVREQVARRSPADASD